MKRLVLEWLISCAADDRRQLPRWVQRQIGRDPRIKAFWRGTQQLEAALGRSPRTTPRRPQPEHAPAIGAIETPSPRGAGRSLSGAGRGGLGWLGAGAAAGIVAAIAAASLLVPQAGGSRGLGQEEPVCPTQLARHLQAAPQTVSAWWLRAADDSQAFLWQQWSSLAALERASAAGLGRPTSADRAPAGDADELAAWLGVVGVAAPWTAPLEALRDVTQQLLDAADSPAHEG